MHMGENYQDGKYAVKISQKRAPPKNFSWHASLGESRSETVSGPGPVTGPVPVPVIFCPDDWSWYWSRFNFFLVAWLLKFSF